MSKLTRAIEELARRADAGDNASLMFLHNTSADKLQRVQDMGGMPMPSIAITDKDIPFENFGDITLVGKPESFDPKSSSLNQAFSADAYTVRAPRPVRIAKKGAGKRFQELYGADAKELDVYAADTVANVWDLEKKGDVREDKYDQVVRWFDDRSGPIFLKDKGIPFNKESRQDIDEKLQPFRQSGEFKQWADNAVDELFEPDQYFVANPDRDYYTQKAKLKPYTADEIAKVMKRSAGRGGEGGMSTSSPGAVRAAYSEKLTSLDAMRKRKDQLSGDIGIKKEEIENLLIDLGDALRPYYKYDPNGWSYRDAVSELMTEGATRGLKRSADFVGFENIPKDLMSELEGFQQILKKAPTEYFESKPKRVVQLNEFGGAIVPEDTSQRTIDLLTRQGLEIERYTDDAQRLAARNKFQDMLFQLPPVAATAVISGIAAVSAPDAQAGPISSGRNVAAELAKRAAAGDTVARQVIDVEAARLTSQGFPEDTAMRIATGELPMDAASRNARAVEQGYDPFETWYHGTADDIAAFDPAKSQSRDFGHAGKGTYVASHPGIARAYANTAAGSADANIMPLRTSANNPLRISLEEKQALGQAGPSATARLQQQAISEGFDSVEVIMPNGEILERVIFDPANIRSTNAAFDPANKGKSALLGGLGGAAVVGGSMTPEEAQAGPLKSGIDVVTELAKRAAAGDTVAAEGIRAYHGSPYSFDRFSTDQIGTGEGNQSYGRGLYFAEREGTAQSYRDALSTTGYKASSGKKLTDMPSSYGFASLMNQMRRNGSSNEDVVKMLRRESDKDDTSPFPEAKKRARAARKLADKVEQGDIVYKSDGSMYEVNIAATPDEFLDYDLPLSQQSDKVRSSVSGMLKSKGFDDSQIQAIIDRDIDGQELNAMLGSFDESKGVKHMTGQGIKGIRYKDGFSRGADGGSSNYVVFDDKLIDIAKKYGVGPVAAAAILAGTMTPEEAQSSQAGMGGMGVRSAPTAQAGLGGMGVQVPQQRPEPTGADLMQQANDDFVSGILNQPEPDFLDSVQQSLLSGIMKTAGIADLSADIASAMFAPVISAPGAVARYATGSTADEIAQARRETEDYFNYQPRTELGPQYGEQAMQAIGGAVSPYIPAIKEAAGESYILGAMKQGYDYLGEREKELAKALMDLSPY